MPAIGGHMLSSRSLDRRQQGRNDYRTPRVHELDHPEPIDSRGLV